MVYAVIEEGEPWQAAMLCPCGCKAQIHLSLLPGDRGRAGDSHETLTVPPHCTPPFGGLPDAEAISFSETAKLCGARIDAFESGLFPPFMYHKGRHDTLKVTWWTPNLSIELMVHSKAVAASGQSLPALVAAAGKRASQRFGEFVTANIRNPNTRRA